MSIQSDIFDEVRVHMDDVEANTFKDTVLIVPFRKLVRDMNHFMIMLGAEVIRQGPKELDLTVVSVTPTTPSAIVEAVYADGDSYTAWYWWALPPDWLAFANDLHGRAYARIRLADRSITTVGLPQFDRKYRDPQNVPLYAGSSSSTVDGISINMTKGVPSWMYVTHFQGREYVAFDVIPDVEACTGLVYYYYADAPHYTDASAQSSPWNGMLNDVFREALTFWARHWKEFTVDLHALQTRQAQNRVQEILGLQVTDEINVTPSMWRGFPAMGGGTGRGHIR